MDSRLESFIKSANSVCGQEKQSLVVLHDAQEDRDNTVPLQVFAFSFGQKHIGFVQKHDAIPSAGKREMFFEILFNFLGSTAQISACDWV